MKMWIVLLLLVAPFAQAAQTYRLDHIQCEDAAGKFRRLKVFPSLKDDTTFAFKAISSEAGNIDFESQHWGLTGGDCRVSLRFNYETTGSRLYLFPQRRTLQRSGSFFSPCETLTADKDREFAFRMTAKNIELEGQDLTGLCGAPTRSNVRLILERK